MLAPKTSDERIRTCEKIVTEYSRESDCGSGRQFGYDMGGSIATNVAEGFTMVAVGDLIVTHPLNSRQDPSFDAIIDILRNADVTTGRLPDLDILLNNSLGV